MCPPGVDQTERGGSEYWTLLVPRLGQVVHVGQVQRYIYDESGAQVLPLALDDWDAFRLLHRKPAQASLSRTEPSIPSNQLPLQPISKKPPTPSRLETLPAEIIYTVLEQPGLQVRDMLSLGLCSKTLWAFVHTHLLSSPASSWAGEQLICTGTWLHSLPESLSSAVGLVDPRPSPPPPPPRLPGGKRLYRNRMNPARQWNYAAHADYEPLCPHFQCAWLDALHALRPAAAIPDPHVWAALERCLRRPYHAYPVGRGWVLRNITAQEYVRLELGAEDGRAYLANGGGGTDQQQQQQQQPLERFLLPRISWSRPVSGYPRDAQAPVPEMPGLSSWAGHRLDIVYEAGCGGEGGEEHEHELGLGKGWRGEEWKDVTDEAQREARTVEGMAEKWEAHEQSWSSMMGRHEGQKGAHYMPGNEFEEMKCHLLVEAAA